MIYILKNKKSEILFSMIDYEYLVDSAMRVLIRDVLITVMKQGGLQGAHHFHITFVTKYDGVQIPSYLIDKYPHEITIALQNQFRNLSVYDDVFSVDLAFGGLESRIIVPFCAITSFVDPSTDFTLKMPPDNNGILGESKFHEMIHNPVERKEKQSENNIINFADIKRLLNQ